MPPLVKADHCQNWSVVACPPSAVTLVSFRGSVVVPVKVAPPSLDVLSRMSLLQAPGVFTPDEAVPGDAYIAELRKRGIRIVETAG